MKKSVKLLAATLVATTALVVSASAASFDHCADMLKSMNLFQGTETGYELDRAPTRAEAAAMLVRLLGKETAAKELTYDAPFTDVLDWQKPYVQYLYTNKLTTGYTETTFNPEAKCDAKMYNTFLLRALGYSDAAGADFTYDKAIDKSKEIGLIDGINCDETNFLRDHVVALSYTALAEMPKDASADSLLEKLVADGAITAESAKPMLTLMDNYVAYAEISAESAKQNKMSMDMVITADATVSGTNLLKMTMNMKTAADTNLEDLNKSKLAMTGDVAIELNKELVGDTEEASVKTQMNAYYTDGMYYFNDGENKVKMEMDFNAAMEALGEMGKVSSEPFSAIRAIEKKGDTYTVSYASGTMNSMIDSVLGSMDLGAIAGATTDMGMKISDMTSTVTAKDGKISAMDMTMKLSMTIEGETMEMNMDMKSTNFKTGADVTVTLPTDLNTYPDPTAVENTPAA